MCKSGASLVFVLLAAFGLRAAALDQENLWIDETFSLWVAGRPLVTGPVEAAAGDVHPPLYFVLMGFWVRLAGKGELAARYPSALVGVLTVALTYGLGRRLFGERAGLWAAVAVAVMGMPVRYAREARMYALLMLLGAASTWAYLRWCAASTRRRAWVYGAATAALLYTHYFGVFIPFVHGLHGLLTRRRWRAWLMVQAGVWAAFAPWLLVLAGQFGMRPDGLRHAAPTSWKTLGWALEMLADGAPWLAGGLAALGAVASMRRRVGQVVLALLWLAVPVAGGLLLNVWVPSLTLRNLIGVTPALALLVGLGASRLPRVAEGAAVALLVYNALAMYPALYPTNLPWRAFVKDVAQEVRADDVLLYHLGPAPVSHPFEYYRRREPDFQAAPVSLFDLPGPPSTEAFSQEVRALVVGAPRVWVATAYETPINWYTFEVLRQTHRLSDRRSFYTFNLYLFEPPSVLVGGGAPYRLGEMFLLAPEVCSAPPYRPGDVFEVALNWETLAAPGVDYSVGLHLVNEAFRPSAQSDAYPDPPTSLWLEGETRRTRHRLALPAELPPGRYDVHLVVYTWWDGRRLWVWDAGAPLLLGDYILLEALEVE